MLLVVYFITMNHQYYLLIKINGRGSEPTGANPRESTPNGDSLHTVLLTLQTLLTLLLS